MPNDSREGRIEAAPVLLAWGIPALDAPEGLADRLALWLTGGVALLLWTAISLLLTS